MGLVNRPYRMDVEYNIVRNGNVLNKGDIVAVYTDGIKNFLHDKSIISLLLNFETTKFEQYIESKSQVDYEKYGKEKTIVLFKN